MLFFGIALDGLVFRQVVDPHQPVADFDAGLFSRTIGSDALRHQKACLLLPPHPIGGNDDLAFFLPIDVGKDDHGEREERQNNGGEPDYGIFAHPLLSKSLRPRPKGCGRWA